MLACKAITKERPDVCFYSEYSDVLEIKFAMDTMYYEMNVFDYSFMHYVVRIVA